MHLAGKADASDGGGIHIGHECAWFDERQGQWFPPVEE